MLFVNISITLLKVSGIRNFYSMQDQYTPNLIHCVEHGFTLRKERCYFYIHNVSPSCTIKNIQVGHVVTDVNQSSISKTTSFLEMISYLREEICICKS